MKLDESMLRFNVTIYGDVETLSPTLSKSRLRIFYRGLNRNRTFISEDFARQLIESLPYVPIKGIFDGENLDYGDHGEKNSDGRIYGIVPENPNFAWEKHVDVDGVEREYACADVYLYTALYPEANLISGKSQSMEIHKKGLDGEWKIWSEDGQPYFEFQKGHLLGLQVLGDEVEPCFEGSAFFSLYKDAKDMFDYLKNSKEKEESKMEKNIFKLSDGAKCELLFDALNKDADSCTMICDISNEYATAYDANAGKYIRAYYTQSDEANLSVDRIEDCYIVNVTENEYNALNAMQAVGTYAEIQAKLDAHETEIAAFTAEKDSLNEQLTNALAELEEYKKDKDDDDDKAKCAKNDDDDKKDDEGEDKKDDDKKDDDKSKNSLEDNSGELQAQIDSYKSEIEAKDAEISRLNQSLADINNEKSELESFKKSVDTEKKTAIIDEFSAYLTDEQVTEFTNKMDNYSVDDFKKEICFAAYNSDTSVFAKSKEDQPDLIYKCNSSKVTESGALALLIKHKGGNR